MNSTEQQTHQKTLDLLAQLEAGLEEAWSRILVNASNIAQADTQARIEKEMKDTQHLLQRLRGRYCLSCPL